MGRIDDGFSTTVDFADFPAVSFWEKEVTPFSIEGGGPNDTTTMRNTAWRTKAPKKLKTLGQLTMTVAYDPAVYDDILDMINHNQLVTLNFADGSNEAAWGWLDAFKPNAAVDGEQPTAEITIECSNQDADGNEIAPVFTPAP